MLINVFSLHRTGSTWWAHYMKNQHRGGVLYNEIFNQLHYFRRNEDRTHTHFKEYANGLCWRAPDESCTEIVFNYRELTDKDNDTRFYRWISYFRQLKHPVIIHTHLTPLQDEKYLTELSKIGDKNYYVYRENSIEQISSFSIMNHTGEYGIFAEDKSKESSKFEYTIVDENFTRWMCKEILRADKLVDDKIINSERISYESMPFYKTVEGMPLKQNVSAFSRLCSEDQELIKRIYTEEKNGM